MKARNMLRNWFTGLPGQVATACGTAMIIMVGVSVPSPPFGTAGIGGIDHLAGQLGTPPTVKIPHSLELASLNDYLSRERLPVADHRDLAPRGGGRDERPLPARSRAAERVADARMPGDGDAAAPTAGTCTEAAALRARLIDFESQQQEVMSSMARALQASTRREEALSARVTQDAKGVVAVAEQGGGPADSSPCVEVASATESDRLRALLDEERRENARLHAKLKLASRATDLIFRLRSQQPETSAGPGGAAPVPVQPPLWQGGGVAQ